ncbi:hypothetical protein HPB49_006641 [Dermacentor silvarum]|uniref:Uncharacterized protein n=1 Tax=Dermacentor silvarum TaxID=543639 RepID=A0ACB8CQM8_DERSI|nr:uncharacterized protein LOC119452388 [Dermacentor silvarum]KAH7949253.1 hypothetical protein HPB49_006641 [Dermacentor silvarum]
MRDPMYFENYGNPLDFEVTNKGEKVLVPNYLVNLLGGIVVLATCAIVASVGVASFGGVRGRRAGISEAPTAAFLPDADEPLDPWTADEWRRLIPSPRPILCFLNREGFLRPPPDTLILRNFPGFYCNEIVYNGLTFENGTLRLLADATDDAILRQIIRVRDALYPHWKVVANVFVEGYAAKKMPGDGTELLDSLFAWLEQRGIDGLNFEFDDDAFLGDLDAAGEVVAFFAWAKADRRWANLTLSAMMPYGVTVLLHEELLLTLDRILLKTHGLLDESSGTTQLVAPLDYAGLTHRRSNHHTVMGILEELEDTLGKKTCFTISLSGTAFTLRSPSQRDVGDPVIPGRPGKASFSDVCANAPGRFKRIEDDAAYTAENYSWVAHEDQFTVFEKTAKVLRHWHLLCVAAVDVDLDDVRGQCGRTYPLLRRIYETSYMLNYSPE